MFEHDRWQYMMCIGECKNIEQPVVTKIERNGESIFHFIFQDKYIPILMEIFDDYDNKFKMNCDTTIKSEIISSIITHPSDYGKETFVYGRNITVIDIIMPNCRVYLKPVMLQPNEKFGFIFKATTIIKSDLITIASQKFKEEFCKTQKTILVYQ